VNCDLLDIARAFLDIEEPNGNWPVASLDTLIVSGPGLVRALTARVAELEACLADVVNQLEIGGVK
jgi:hypothetical protein